MSPEELRNQLAHALMSAAVDMSTVRNPWDAADIALDLPAIRRALALAAHVDAEPTFVELVPYDVVHNRLYADLRAVGEQT